MFGGGNRCGPRSSYYNRYDQQPSSGNTVITVFFIAITLYVVSGMMDNVANQNAAGGHCSTRGG
jgi:hypothetical protein